MSGIGHLLQAGALATSALLAQESMPARPAYAEPPHPTAAVQIEVAPAPAQIGPPKSTASQSEKFPLQLACFGIGLLGTAAFIAVADRAGFSIR